MLTLLLACVPELYSDIDPNLELNDWSAPENTWDMGTPPDTLQADGCGEGDVLNELRGTDQYGDTVRSWQFYGSCMVIDIGAGWCPPCRELAEHLPSMAADHPDVEFLSVLVENVEYQPAQPEDVAEWAEVFEIEEPVLNDPDEWASCAWDDGLPVVMVIGPDMRVLEDSIEPATPENVERVVGELCGG